MMYKTVGFNYKIMALNVWLLRQLAIFYHYTLFKAPKCKCKLFSCRTVELKNFARGLLLKKQTLQLKHLELMVTI